MRAAAAVSGWDPLAKAYEEAIDAADSEDDKLQLRSYFGATLRKLGKIDEAIEQYRAVYDEMPDHTDAIQALGELYRETGKHQELLDIYERRLELEDDPEVRKKLAYGRATLFQGDLSQRDKAIEAYLAILDEFGDEEARAFAALDALYEAAGRHKDLASILERRIDLQPESTEELAALKFRLGQLLRLELNDKPRAVELFREVLTLEPEHDGARQALEALLGDEEVAVSAAEILEPIYEEREDWVNLVRALEVRAKGEEDREQKHDLFVKMAEIFGTRIGDATQGFDALAQAIKAMGERTETLAQLEMLAVEQDRFPELVAIVSDLAGSTDDPVLARTMWLKAAEFHATQLGNVEGSIAAYEKILAQDPSDMEVLDRLENLHRRTERWSALVGVLRKKVEQTVDAEVQQGLLAQMAHIHDEMLEQPDEAIQIFSEILDLDPTNHDALGALDQLYERLERWSELADNLERRLALAEDPEEQVAIKLRAAEVRERYMGSPEAALEIYRDVLHQDPSSASALEALERLLGDAKYQLQAAEILEPVYLETNAYQKLIGVHEIQIQHADSAERKVELLHRVAELYEMALDNVTNAFATFARAFAVDPANESTAEQLERLAGVTADYEGLARVYAEKVGAIEDPTLVAQIHFKIASIRQHQLNDAPGAIEHFEKVLEIEDDNLEAATALEQLYQVSERYEKLAGIYRRKASMIPDPDARKEHLFRAAAAYEELLDNPAEAVKTYELALEVDPEDLGALDKLIEIHARGESWDALLAAYARKIDVVIDPDDKKALLVDVGAVYEHQLKDTVKAIDTYQRILEVDPEDRTALARLDVLYQAAEEWQELLSVLERESDLEPEPEQAVMFRFRIADLWRTRLEDPMRAVDIHREILEVMPEYTPSIEALEQMMAANEEPLDAAAVLDPLYRASGDAERLARVMEVQIANEEDPVRKVELLHELATLSEVQLSDGRRAFDAYVRALPEEPENEVTLGSLERLAEELNAWAELGALYDATVEKLGEDPDAKANLAMRAAQLYELQIGDADKAIERYNVAVEADPTRMEGIEALDRLFEATERWAELVSVLRREIDGATSPEAILNLQFRLGQVEQHRLAHLDEAIEHYREILAAAPEYTPALSALESLFSEGKKTAEIAEILEPHYRVQEQWDKLVDVHERQLGTIEDRDERVSLMHRVAETAEERAGEPEVAFVWMQRALAEDPSHDHSLAEIERLATGVDGWANLAATYAEIAGDTRHAAELRVDISKRGARVYLEELDDIGRAEEMYRYVLGLSPNDEDALAALTQIYEQFGALEALATTLRRRVNVVEHPDDKVALSYQLGQLLQHDLGRSTEAIAVYQNVIDGLEPGHTESIRALESIYAQAGDWPKLFQTFEKELEVVHGDQAQAEVLARMAYIAFHTLRDPDKSVELWRRVLDLRGEDPEALNAIGDVLASQENWTDLVDILDREASVVDDDTRRIAICGDMARVWYEKLGKERNAIDSWERVLDIDPGNVDALYNIAEIHRAAKHQQEFADTLQRIIDAGASSMRPEELSKVHMQLGFVFWSGMEQPQDAVEAYARAIELNPRNHEALDAMEFIQRKEENWEAAIDVMEQRARALSEPMAVRAQLLSIARMWANEAGNADGGTSAYQRMLEADARDDYAFKHLEELHGAAGRWEDLIEMYLGRLDITEENDARIDLLRRIAKVYEEKLDDGPNAYEALKFAWGADFSNKQVATDLERVARDTNSWNDLLTNANNWLRETNDPATKIAICLNCARWYGTGIGRRDYAIPYFEQINQLDPNNVESKQQLAELYHTTQQYDHERQVLEGLVTLTSDPEVKADTYVKIGDLCRGALDVPEQAQAYYQSALSESANHVPALDALAELHREAEAWGDLLSVLKRKVKALSEPSAVAEAKLEVAQLYEERLDRFEDAITTYREARDLEPENLDALRGLDRLYTASEQWQELAEVLESEAGVVTTERDRINILVRLATMWQEQFVKPEKAVERFEQVLEIDPHHTGALNALGVLYRQIQDWDRLMATYERHVEATPERDEKRRVYRQMAELYAHELQNPDRAVDCYLAALEINEDDVEALDGLTRVYEKRGDHAQALETMERIAALAPDKGRRVDLYARMGRILDEQLGDRVAAIDNYRQAIDLDPAHVPSLEALGRIYRESADWLAAVKVLEQEANHRENPRAAARTLVELGRIFDEHLDEHESAVSAFERALAKDPDNEDAAMPLATEYAGSGRAKDAYPILEMLFLRSDKREPEEQRRIAMLYGETASKVAERQEAIKAFTKAYQADPQDLQALVALANAYFDASEWADAFKYFQMLLVHHRENLSKTETTDVFFKLGVVKREQGEVRKAINMFDKALEEDGYHRPTLEALVEVHSKQQEWDKTIHYKRQLVESRTRTTDASRSSKRSATSGRTVGNQQRRPSRPTPMQETRRQARGAQAPPQATRCVPGGRGSGTDTSSSRSATWIRDPSRRRSSLHYRRHLP
ncbi:MAG: tetratricopeptide repeat protein [Polyangiales bacterium]